LTGRSTFRREAVKTLHGRKNDPWRLPETDAPRKTRDFVPIEGQPGEIEGRPESFPFKFHGKKTPRSEMEESVF